MQTFSIKKYIDLAALRFVNFITIHKFILISALIMALLVFAPVILFPLVTDSYRGINSGNFSEDEFHYLAKGKEILDGNGLGNIILKEGKDWYNTQQTYIEYLIVLPIKLLGISDKIDLVNIFYIYGFLGVFLLILLIYFFILQLSGDKLLAVVISLFVIGGYTFITRYSFSADLNVYGRPVIPIFNSIAFFIYLNFLVKSLKSQDWRHIFFAGISFGSLFYIYFYGWTYTFTLTGILLVIYLLKKDFISIKKIFIITALSLLIGVYELVQLVLFSSSDMGKQILFFGGGHYSHDFIFIKISLLAFLLFVFFAYKNKENDNLPIILAIILANFVSINQQIITGRELQVMHYFWHFIIPTSIIVGLYMIWLLIRNVDYKKILFIVLLITIFVNISVRSYKGLLSTMEMKMYAQNYGPIINYLNKDSTPGVILASDSFYELLFTVYTSHDLFWHENAIYFNTPMKRVKDALFVYLYLNKESRNNFIDYLNLENVVKSNLYTIPYLYIETYNSGLQERDFSRLSKESLVFLKIHQKVSNSLYAEYQDIIKNRDGIKNILRNDGVNYIVWDKNKNPEWDLSVLDGVKELMSFNNIYLYSVEY